MLLQPGAAGKLLVSITQCFNINVNHPTCKLTPSSSCFLFLDPTPLHNIATEQTILWIIIYATATALTLIPSPLLEFRYFITPYLIYRISMRQPRGTWLLLELLGYGMINVTTLWLFMNRPFRWSHEDGVQRFMW